MMMRIYTTPVTFGGPTNEGSPYYNFKKDIKDACKNIEPIEKEEITLKIVVFIQKERVVQKKMILIIFSSLLSML